MCTSILAAECTLTKGCGLKEDDDTEEEELQEDDERSNSPLYNNLVSSDLETVTLNELVSEGKIDGFDLIVAADVLVYFGDIQKLVSATTQLSFPPPLSCRCLKYFIVQLLIFSCERIEEDDKAPPVEWKLQSSGRYAHSKSYVVDVASNAGYELVSYEEIVPRMEKGEEVKGHLFIFVIGGSVEGDNDYIEVIESVLEDEDGRDSLLEEL